MIEELQGGSMNYDYDHSALYIDFMAYEDSILKVARNIKTIILDKRYVWEELKKSLQSRYKESLLLAQSEEVYQLLSKSVVGLDSKSEFLRNLSKEEIEKNPFINKDFNYKFKILSHGSIGIFYTNIINREMSSISNSLSYSNEPKFDCEIKSPSLYFISGLYKSSNIISVFQFAHISLNNTLFYILFEKIVSKLMKENSNIYKISIKHHSDDKFVEY
jgi:hypothetical protein